MLSEERKTQLFLQADESLNLLYSHLKSALDETVTEDEERSFICAYIGRLLLEAGSIWMTTEFGIRDAEEMMEPFRAALKQTRIVANRQRKRNGVPPLKFNDFLD